MRILVLSARAPRRSGRGDQNRLAMLLPYLAEHHTVTLVTGERPARGDIVPGIDTIVIETPGIRRVPGVVKVLATLPVQTAWFTPPALWERAKSLSDQHDVVLAVTARSLRGSLSAPLVVDHVDALSYNMRARAQGPEAATRRMAARWEARRFTRWEQAIAEFSAHRIATSDGVSGLLPEGSPITVVPAAWDGAFQEDCPGHVRDLDVVLTGDMRYPPNREAARRLLHEILPRVRQRRPELRAAIVGRHVANLVAPGVELYADVPDLHAYLHRAKVAVSPIRGEGSPFKVLEAAACGAAVVGTGWGLRAYGIRDVVAESPDDFADAIVRLLDDDDARLRVAAAARDAARAHDARSTAGRFEAILAAVADVRGGRVS